MEINRTTGAESTQRANLFKIYEGEEEVGIHSSKIEIADAIDIDRDKILKDDEIKAYLRKREILKDPRCAVDEEEIVSDFKLTLQNKELPQKAAYHSYDSMVEDMKSLQEKYPTLAKMVSLGKSYEGREIWALKIMKDANIEPPQPPPVNPPANPPPGQPGAPAPAGNETQPPSNPPGNQPGQDPVEPPPARKPGILLTGVHHAREWISAEIPIYSAHQLLENYATDETVRKRVDNAEIWVVPIVNPDGYEYSRNEDSWWRKNRRPITQTACDIEGGGNLSPGDKAACRAVKEGEKEAFREAVKEDDSGVKGYGVDPNRNYYDGTPEHLHLYRKPDDTPCSTWDDYGASDAVYSDTFRGPSGGSESEVQALQKFQLENKNIKGVLDYHSYGQMILYPWGNTYDPAENVEEYKNLAQGMADQMEAKYRPMQSADLYPSSGSSEDFEHALGMLGITVEVGRTFQPKESEIPTICQQNYKANTYFIDYVIANQDKIRT